MVKEAWKCLALAALTIVIGVADNWTQILQNILNYEALHTANSNFGHSPFTLDSGYWVPGMCKMESPLLPYSTMLDFNHGLLM